MGGFTIKLDIIEKRINHPEKRSGNFWGLFDCHSLGMGALWAFIRLGEGIRDDMFSALHNKKTPCLTHPVSLLRRAGDLVFLVLGGAASTPRTRT